MTRSTDHRSSQLTTDSHQLTGGHRHTQTHRETHKHTERDEMRSRTYHVDDLHHRCRLVGSQSRCIQLYTASQTDRQSDRETDSHQLHCVNVQHYWSRDNDETKAVLLQGNCAMQHVFPTPDDYLLFASVYERSRPLYHWQSIID